MHVDGRWRASPLAIRRNSSTGNDRPYRPIAHLVSLAPAIVDPDRVNGQDMRARTRPRCGLGSCLASRPPAPRRRALASLLADGDQVDVLDPFLPAAVRQLRLAGARASAQAWSTDGRLLIVASTRALHVFDADADFAELATCQLRFSAASLCAARVGESELYAIAIGGAPGLLVCACDAHGRAACFASYHVIGGPVVCVAVDAEAHWLACATIDRRLVLCPFADVCASATSALADGAQSAAPAGAAPTAFRADLPVSYGARMHGERPTGLMWAPRSWQLLVTSWDGCVELVEAEGAQLVPGAPAGPLGTTRVRWRVSLMCDRRAAGALSAEWYPPLVAWSPNGTAVCMAHTLDSPPERLGAREHAPRSRLCAAATGPRGCALAAADGAQSTWAEAAGLEGRVHEAWAAVHALDGPRVHDLLEPTVGLCCCCAPPDEDARGGGRPGAGARCDESKLNLHACALACSVTGVLASVALRPVAVLQPADVRRTAVFRSVALRLYLEPEIRPRLAPEIEARPEPAATAEVSAASGPSDARTAAGALGASSAGPSGARAGAEHDEGAWRVRCVPRGRGSAPRAPARLYPIQFAHLPWPDVAAVVEMACSARAPEHAGGASAPLVLTASATHLVLAHRNAVYFRRRDADEGSAASVSNARGDDAAATEAARGWHLLALTRPVHACVCAPGAQLVVLSSAGTLARWSLLTLARTSQELRVFTDEPPTATAVLIAEGRADADTAAAACGVEGPVTELGGGARGACAAGPPTPGAPLPPAECRVLLVQRAIADTRPGTDREPRASGAFRVAALTLHASSVGAGGAAPADGIGGGDDGGPSWRVVEGPATRPSHQLAAVVPIGAYDDDDLLFDDDGSAADDGSDADECGVTTRL